MPKGLKICPSCSKENGVKTKICKHCQSPFPIKEKPVKDPSSPGKRGRKKGSVNKPKQEVENTTEQNKGETIIQKRAARPASKRVIKYNISHLGEADKSWFLDLAKQYQKELNIDNPEQIWDDYITNKIKGNYIIGIRPYAFCHFQYLEDGTKSICEIAVAISHQKKGLGKLLIEDVGKPIIVACFKDIEMFYKKLGFTWFGNVIDHKGVNLEVYKWQ